MSIVVRRAILSSVTRGTGVRRRAWQVVVVVLVVLAAGAAGVLIGRATKAGEKARPAESWQSLPEAPIAGRLSPGAVWTGKEMIVWGGATKEAARGPVPCNTCTSDGAAYDPATRTWHAIAKSPPGVQGGASGVVWTRATMVVWASNSPDGPVGTAVYDPSTDSWRRLPAGPLGRREGYSSVWTGKELIVVGGSLGDTLARPVAAALDPRTGSWRLLPALNRITGLMPGPGVVWDGHDVWVMGSVCKAHATSCSPTLLAYDPATDALRRIDLAKAPIAPQQQLALIGASGTDLVFSTTGLANMRILIVRYDPAAGSWKRGGRSHRFPSRSGPTRRRPGSGIATWQPTDRAVSRSTASTPTPGRRSPRDRPRSTPARGARSSGREPT